MPEPIDAFGRLGTETAFEVLARAQKLAAEGKDIINLGIGQPDFRTPEHIVNAGKEALDAGAHGYTPAAGIPQLREAVAADLNKRHGVSVDASSVLITPGAKPVMYFAMSTASISTFTERLFIIIFTCGHICFINFFYIYI